MLKIEFLHNNMLNGTKQLTLVESSFLYEYDTKSGCNAVLMLSVLIIEI